MVFECKAGEWALPDDLIAELAAAYPLVDVEAELRKAVVWCECNPSKRKTPRGMKRFCHAWIARASAAVEARQVTERRAVARSVPVSHAGTWWGCPHQPVCGTARQCDEVKKAAS